MKINKLKLLAIAVCSLAAALWSETHCMEQNSEGLEGRYLIRSIKHKGEYLYLSDLNRVGGDRIAQGAPMIAANSIFTFEKSPKGYLIKNVKHNEYLYSASVDRINGDRIVGSHKDTMKKSYFSIIKKDEGFLIKSIKHDEYLYLASADRVNGDRVGGSHKDIMQKSYFDFILDDKGLF